MVVIAGRRASRVLALDIASTTGWVLMQRENDTLEIVQHGNVTSGASPGDTGLGYPWSYVQAAETLARNVRALVMSQLPNRIVIEETNGGGRAARFSQKLLEFFHLAVLSELQDLLVPVDYVSTGDWRKILKIQLTKEERKANAKLSKAKSAAKSAGKALDKKALGIKGRVTPKHLAVKWTNENFNLQLKQGENDIADAVCLVVSWFAGAPLSTGGGKAPPSDLT